jgi:hypothetical protein
MDSKYRVILKNRISGNKIVFDLEYNRDLSKRKLKQLRKKFSLILWKQITPIHKP